MNRSIMKSLIAKHQALWLDKAFVVSVAVGIFLFDTSFVVNYNAIKYATNQAGDSSADILLDNLPVVNTDVIFSEGALLFIVFVTCLCFLQPKIIPFILKSVALFILIRSGFVIMTHLGPIPERIVTDLDNFRYITSGADLFFSGHTGLPFLMALLFWENKHLRWIFLFCSIVAAIAVILGHLHYTIDVFSAFFIAYGICHLAKKFFRKDLKYFDSRQGASQNISGL